MFFKKGMFRYLALTITVLLFYVLSGGRLKTLWQPFEFSTIIAINIMYCRWAIGNKSIDSVNPEYIRTVGKTALATSLSVLFLLVTMLIVGSLDSEIFYEELGKTVAAQCAIIFHALTIYFSFYALSYSEASMNISKPDNHSKEKAA